MKNDAVINWLLEGDVAIQYQVHRDLLGSERPDLQKRIAQEGWGAQLLAARNPDGYWSERYYQPKWISAHYTLLDLKNLNIEPDNLLIRQTLQRVFKEEKSEDGGINPANSIAQSDVCVNGMALNFAAYFKVDEENLKSVIDFLLSQHMPDGGFNCRSNRSGAKHSSMHTTLSVLEGLFEYESNGYTYRLDEVRQVQAAAQEFLVDAQAFQIRQNREIIQERFLRFPYPCRWYYDILRAMDYFQLVRAKIRSADG
jgi:prenyltransferase beta subunit